MKNQLLSLCSLIAVCLHANAQVAIVPASPSKSSDEIFFVSDTQQPLMVEKILLHPNQNKRATAGIFATILEQKPRNLYMLGDVVGLGYANKKWKNVDLFLDSCRKSGTDVCGILGNHEVMGRRKKGERNFQKRFPMNVKTGYVSVTDSIAVVLLNSNFSSLTATEEKKQQDWYEATMKSLDATDSVKAVIVCCHHAPYTKSKVVKCSNEVQKSFVDSYIDSKKAQLFITGHCHAFEHFKVRGKDFVVIGGGGGLHQPLGDADKNLVDLANDYKPMFHYLSVKRKDSNLVVTSHYLKDDFKQFDMGVSFSTQVPSANLASAKEKSALKSGEN